MERLEQYLDHICRSIGGPRSMREHVRQELREHLLDAVDKHKTAGLPEQAALEQALEEFGKPEEVRSELEAAHGQRMLMAVVIDKALDWKEMTMKAKWLWTTWAYLALALVIVFEVMWLTFANIFLTPKFRRLMLDGIIDPAIVNDAGVHWMVSFLIALDKVGGSYTTFLFLGAVAAWGVFEWRVRSENKPFMRLSGLGTLAVALTLISVITAGSLVIPYMLGAPAMGRLARPYALMQIDKIDTSLSALEQALAKKDWQALQEQTNQATEAMSLLGQHAALTPALTASWEAQAIEQMRTQVRLAFETFAEVQHAARGKNQEQMTSALQRFRKTYEPIQEAARKPVR